MSIHLLGEHEHDQITAQYAMTVLDHVQQNITSTGIGGNRSRKHSYNWKLSLAHTCCWILKESDLSLSHRGKIAENVILALLNNSLSVFISVT